MFVLGVSLTKRKTNSKIYRWLTETIHWRMEMYVTVLAII